ncbi:MAG TPA: autotransporter-associated beta strand repeat-containing protein, partial [Cyclobacteriaceae bacterium]|nr:autotransporter-associated beta strand repeat-containing protein [Cyclobacteriaceae bacterium]
MHRFYEDFTLPISLIFKNPFLNSRKVTLSVTAGILLLFSTLSESFGQATFRTVASGNWNSGAVWAIVSGSDGDGIPDADDDVIIRGAFTVNVNVNSFCSTLQIGGTASGSLNNAGTLNINTNISMTVTNSVTVGGFGSSFRTGTLTFSNGSVLNAGNLTFGNAGGTPGTPNEIDMAAGGTLRVGSFTVNSTGITNNWTPGAGTVEMTAANTLPTQDITSFNNLTINGGTTTLGVNIPVAGTLRVDAGTLAMGIRNITTVAAINMTGTSITGTGTITLAGDITTNASGTTASISAPIALGGSDRTLTIADGGATPDLQISSVISGTAGFQKSGSGLLHVFGANSYSGTTTVAAGILRVGSPSGLGSTAGGTIVNSGGALDIIGINYSSAEPLTLNGSGISGSGALFNSSATGATFGGLITLGSSATISGSTGTINVSNTGTITGSGFDLTLDGASGGTLASAIGTGSGNVIKSGSG